MKFVIVHINLCSDEQNGFMFHFQEERRHFAKLLNSGERLQLNWENRNHGTVPDQVLFDKYFHKLSDSDIKGLVDLYRLDFKMFNYTFSYRNKTYIWHFWYYAHLTYCIKISYGGPFYTLQSTLTPTMHLFMDGFKIHFMSNIIICSNAM